MTKHPTDHDHDRDDGKVAKEFTRIEREQADGASDPKVQKLSRAERDSEADGARLKAFLKIDRQKGDS